MINLAQFADLARTVTHLPNGQRRPHSEIKTWEIMTQLITRAGNGYITTLIALSGDQVEVSRQVRAWGFLDDQVRLGLNNTCSVTLRWGPDETPPAGSLAHTLQTIYLRRNHDDALRIFFQLLGDIMWLMVNRSTEPGWRRSTLNNETTRRVQHWFERLGFEARASANSVFVALPRGRRG